MLFTKHRYRYYFAALLSSAMVFSACGKTPHQQRPLSSDASHDAAIRFSAVERISIVDTAGKPVPGARMLIGTRENIPFPGNLILADGSGTVAVPQEWTDAQPVTIEAKGYLRATYFARKPGSFQLTLRPQPSTARHELKGETSGYKDLSKDGTVDIGVVFPLISREQLALLQASSVISPEIDRITVAGQDVDIPSNVAIPTQRESYIISITLDKPQYRIYMNEPRTWRVVAAHARFPFKSVVSDLRDGKAFVEIVNKFTFTGASLKDVNIKSGANAMNLPINELEFRPSIQVVAPTFDPAYSMLGLAMIEDQGLFYPSDVKRFAPKEKRTLTAPATEFKGNLVSVLRRNDAPDIGAKSSELSAVVTPLNQSQALEFLPIVKAPELKSGTLALNPPSTGVASVSPVLTYGLLSKIETVQRGDLKLENKTAQWELYAEEWVKDLTLPQLPASFDDNETLAPEKFRWEVLFGGQPAAGAGVIGLGPAALEKVSHVTRSAVDL